MREWKVAAAVLVCAVMRPPMVDAAAILSPVAVIDAPPTLVTGFSFDRTIDQSGLGDRFDSGTTDFDAYVTGAPEHAGTITPQTYAASSREPPPFLDVDYDLGARYDVARMAFWNENRTAEFPAPVLAPKKK